MPSVPSFEELTWPTLRALKAMGGSGTNKELLSKIIELERLPLEVQAIRHNDQRQTKLNYNLIRAKTYLKKAGAIDNTSWGIWSITAFGESVTEHDGRVIPSRVRKQRAVERFGGSILGDDESRSLLAEADRGTLSQGVFKHPGGFYLVAEPDGTIARFESIEGARGWAYSLPANMVDEGHSAPGPSRAIVEQLPPAARPMTKRHRWKYAIVGVFALIVTGMFSWGVYYGRTEPAWEAQMKIQQEKERAKAAALEKTEKDQEAAELEHCVVSKGSDPICKKVCILYGYKPGFMSLAGVDCLKFGIVSTNQDMEDAGFCIGSKGKDPICKKVCMNHGRHGELTPLGIDCTKFGVALDDRLPFEKQTDEDQRNFDQAVALCAFSSKAACEHQRGDPWPP